MVEWTISTPFLKIAALGLASSSWTSSLSRQRRKVEVGLRRYLETGWTVLISGSQRRQSFTLPAPLVLMEHIIRFFVLSKLMVKAKSG
jgi:hypothetical protein